MGSSISRRSTTTRNLHRGFAGLVLTAALASIAAPAFADDPVDLDGAYVYDSVDALGGSTDDVDAAIESLYDDTQLQLYVTYVDSFDGADDRKDWVEQTAALNNLGDNNILVAIAVDDRVYQLWQADNLDLSDDELSDIATDYLVPGLRDEDWSTAVVDFAGGISDAELGGGGDDGGTVVPPGDDEYLPGTDPFGDPFGNPVEEQASSLRSIFPALFGLVAVGIIIAIIVRAVSRSNASTSRRSFAPAPGHSVSDDPLPTEPPVPAGPTQQELDARAGTLLVQLDDALTTSEQELGFAVAQFGEPATAPFAAALASAKATIVRAFALRQKLDDAVPDTDAERRAWTTEVIELCEAAEAELDAQSDDFDALRELENNAASVIATVDAELPALRQGHETIQSALAALETRYSPAAIAPAAGNAEQTGRLVALATTALADARASLAAGRSGEAAVAVRTAQAASGQAAQLIAAVPALENSLSTAADGLAAEIAETRQDVVEARATGSSELAPAIAATEAALEYAETSGTRDPATSLARVEKQAGLLNEALTGIRERGAQVSRARALLPGSIRSAQSQLQIGEQFLATRRGGVGTDARTRLASARQHLDAANALAPTDPVSALTEAEQAQSLASEGTRLAQEDVDRFDGGPGGGFGNGGDATGALVGGLLAGLFLGGGSNSSNNDWFGGGGGGSSFGGFGGSGFGGSGFGGGGHGGGGGSFGGGGGGGHAGGGGGF